MIKNLFLLGLLTCVSFTYAMQPVARESIGEASNFKVEKPVEEQDAQRSVAGARIKKSKKKEANPEIKDGESSKDDTESEVRYWEYAE